MWISQTLQKIALNLFYCKVCPVASYCGVPRQDGSHLRDGQRCSVSQPSPSLGGMHLCVPAQRGLFPTPRPRGGPARAPARPAPSPGAGPDGGEGLLREAPAGQGPGSVVPRLVWHRQELRGADAGGKPVPGRAEERLCQGVHLYVALPSPQECGPVRGEAGCAEELV